MVKRANKMVAGETINPENMRCFVMIKQLKDRHDLT